MSTLDEVELAKLEEAVQTAKKLLAFGGAGSEATSMLVGASLASSEHRIAFLEQEIDGAFSERGRKESEKNQALVAGYLVQREIHLSSSERQQFAGFLESPFFTRADFDDLDEFYGAAYDRLSERGKAEMSFRVWEGIREGECQFTDLPPNTKEKEAERLLAMLSNPEKMPESLRAIPEKDREAFVDAMVTGESEKAHEILNRESFAEHVSTSVEVGPTQDEVECVQETKETASLGADAEASLDRVESRSTSSGISF